MEAPALVQPCGGCPPGSDVLTPLELLAVHRLRGGLEAARWLQLYLKHARDATDNPRRRRVDLRSAGFQLHVGRVPGAVEFLLLCGWRQAGAKGEEDKGGRYLEAPWQRGEGRKREEARRQYFSARMKELHEVVFGDAERVQVRCHSIHTAMEDAATVYVRFELIPPTDCTSLGAQWCSACCTNTAGGRAEWEPQQYTTEVLGPCRLRVTLLRRRVLFLGDTVLGRGEVEFDNMTLFSGYAELRCGQRTTGHLHLEIDTLALKFARARRSGSGADRPPAVTSVRSSPSPTPSSTVGLLPSPREREFPVWDAEDYFGDLRLGSVQSALSPERVVPAVPSAFHALPINTTPPPANTKAPRQGFS
eukprot:Hpha_TRINITY_DN10591_c0_g1::TRINITY_DN10591_c0_g1_i1::g.31361::m.31361